MGRPNAPSQIKIDGEDETPNMATKAMGDVTISGKVTDTDGGRVRLVLRYQKIVGDKEGRVIERRSDPVNSGDRASIHLTDLGNDVKYVAKAFTADTEDKISEDHNAVSWWMNRRADTNAVSPAENAQHDPTLPLVFDWNYSDPDGGGFDQTEWQLRWRRAATPDRLAGEWKDRGGETGATEHTVVAGTFNDNVVYEWQARGKDDKNLWAHWSNLRSFTTIGQGKPPRLDSPINGEAVPVADATTFRWRFRDPDKHDEQVKADLRYRALGAEEWVTIFGDNTTPGDAYKWVIAADTFSTDVIYEWSVRTYDDGSGGTTPGPWAEPETFVGIPSGDPLPIIDTDSDDAVTLGCGTYRAFIYDRGGLVNRGEITPLRLTRWKRIRDDIGGHSIITNGFDADCGQLLASARCWMHELVLFRVLPDGSLTRVAEGPITRITYKRDQVEIEAKDVMAYVYRRIMRQGYNDAFRKVKGEQLGLTPVVLRAAKIIQNALSYHNPNLLQYLTILHRPSDAKQSRIVADYAKTAFEEVDDLAANAGLDYTAIGRRICLWDTHNQLGVLPEMTDRNFDDSLIVSEYGMLLANHFGVTDGTGVHGEAKPRGTAWSNKPEAGKIDQFEFYGPVEQLASSYGTGGAATTGETVEQRDQRTRRALVYAEQAQRNIADRWPTPLIVRLPDNTTMNPDTPVAVNHLVPGVWVPLRAQETLRQVVGWQKLDRVECEIADKGNEQIRVTMSPAPNGGSDDPDASGETDDI